MVGRLVVKGKGPAWRGLVTELQLGAGKKVCKLLNRRDRFAGYPHPGCFCKRAWKPLKTKGGRWKKCSKSAQESAR
jgi:hypothetical protein